MKNYFIILLIIVIGVLSPIIAIAAPHSTVFVELKQEEGEIVRPDPVKGKRCPSVKYYYSINLEDYAVETNIPETIILYEILGEDGNTLLVSSLSSDVAMYLSSIEGIEGAFQLCLVTAENTYIGYMEL